jgi:hypothetical protein
LNFDLTVFKIITVEYYNQLSLQQQLAEKRAKVKLFFLVSTFDILRGSSKKAKLLVNTACISLGVFFVTVSLLEKHFGEGTSDVK